MLPHYDTVRRLLDVRSEDTNSGQIEALCPAHEDFAPSLSLGRGEGGKALITCHAGCEPSEVVAALGLTSERSMIRRPRASTLSCRSEAPRPLPDQSLPERQHTALMRRGKGSPLYRFLTADAGLTDDTLQRFCVGIDGDRITFPVRVNGKWHNIRRYKPGAEPGQKMRNVKGHGGAVLFPSEVLDGWDGPVLLCEGERDALLANQHSEGAYVALSGTGGAGTLPRDLHRLADREVFVAYDCDDAGQAGARKVAEALADVAASVHILDLTDLGLPRGSKEDVSDYFLHRNGTAEALVAEMERLREEADEATLSRRRLISQRADDLAIQREARALDASRYWTPPDGGVSLAERLKTPVPPLPEQIAVLSFVGANVLLVAVEKAGKTVLALNVARSLLAGEPFLGRFDVEPVPEGRAVAWWNAELSDRQADLWLSDMAFARPEDMFPLHLRGQDLSLTVPTVSDWAVEWLRARRVAVWVLDPFSALFHGDENSNSEVGEWLRALDSIKARAGVETVYLVHHASSAGDGAESTDDRGLRALRGRGATRLGGWADIKWTYTGSYDEPRVLSAFGRDVDLPPMDGIQFDPATRLLRWDGSTASPSERRREALALQAYDAIKASGGEPLLTKAVHDAMDGAKPDPKRSALNWAESRGWIRRGPGPKNSTLHTLGEVNPRVLKVSGGPSENQ